MKNGIQLIQQERNSQLRKHGYTRTSDKAYVKKELVQAAKYALETVGHGPGFEAVKNRWPIEWGSYHEKTIAMKEDYEKLAVAGAFYMAENDRLGYDKYKTVIEKIAARIDKILFKLKP